MAAFAGGNVGHNQISVAAFGQTSLVMSVLAIISAVIVVLYIKDEIRDLMWISKLFFSITILLYFISLFASFLIIHILINYFVTILIFTKSLFLIKKVNNIYY